MKKLSEEEKAHYEKIKIEMTLLTNGLLSIDER